MTIECRCPGCGQRFRAALAAAGHRIKCPQCATMIQLPNGPPPAPAPPKPVTPPSPPGGRLAWFVRTSDEKQHGPIDKAQLDRLVAQHRLDAFCEVRRADWEQWRLIEDVYSSLAIGDGDDDLLADDGRAGATATYDIEASARVRPCPDCDQTVSLRAVQCPHCGCPLIGRPPGVPRPSAPAAAAAVGGGKRRRLFGRIVFLTVAIALLLVVIVAGVYVGLQILNRTGDVVVPVEPSPPESPVVVTFRPAPSPPATPVATPLSVEQIAQCKDRVAEAMARQVDDAQRAKHTVSESMSQWGNLVDELTNPGKKRPEGKKAPKPSRPYESQFEALRRDCRAYLDAQVKEPVDSEQAIWSVGENWVKMQLPQEAQILENLLQPSTPPSDTP